MGLRRPLLRADSWLIRSDGRLSSSEDREIAIVNEQTIPPLARQLSGDATLDHEVHRRRRGGERQAGRGANTRQRLDGAGLERFVDAERGAGAPATTFQRRAIDAKQFGETARRADGAVGDLSDAVDEKVQPRFPVTAAFAAPFKIR